MWKKIYIPKTNGWNLKNAPLGKGETSTFFANNLLGSSRFCRFHDLPQSFITLWSFRESASLEGEMLLPVDLEGMFLLEGFRQSINRNFCLWRHRVYPWHLRAVGIWKSNTCEPRSKNRALLSIKYWLVNRDPCSGWPPYNWVGFHPLYTTKKTGALSSLLMLLFKHLYVSKVFRRLHSPKTSLPGDENARPFHPLVGGHLIIWRVKWRDQNIL